jgi:DNA invertase Pin-like site-specific DNA recombinase
MPRAVIYARFSTDRQDKITNESQIDQCTKYALSRGFEIAGIFQDEAESGTNYWSREQVQAR